MDKKFLIIDPKTHRQINSIVGGASLSQLNLQKGVLALDLKVFAD